MDLLRGKTKSEIEHPKSDIKRLNIIKHHVLIFQVRQVGSLLKYTEDRCSAPTHAGEECACFV